MITNSTVSVGQTSPFEARAIRDHRPIHQSQLQFKKGDIIWVFETAPTGWSRGECNGKRGLFPHSYVVSTAEATTPSPSSSDNVSEEIPQPTFSLTSSSSTDTNITSTIHPPPPLITTINSTPIHNKPTPLPRKPYPSITNSDVTQSQSPVNGTLPTLLLPNPHGGGSAAHPKLSPRFNVNKEMLENSISTLRGASPVVFDARSEEDENEGLKKHGRKNSGPSTYISHGEDDSPLNFSSGNIGSNPTLSPISENQSSPSSTSPPLNSSPSPSPPTLSDDYKNPLNKYKTLPHNQPKIRKPLSSITSLTPVVATAEPHDGQPPPSQPPSQPKPTLQQQVPPPNNQKSRITVDQVNTDIPYYISRCVLAHTKQSYDEITLNVGDLVIVYNMSNIYSEWWVGKVGSVFGVFPKKCVDIIKDISPKQHFSNSTTTPTSPSNSTDTTQSTTIKTPPTYITPRSLQNSSNTINPSASSTSSSPHSHTPPQNTSSPIISKHNLSKTPPSAPATTTEETNTTTTTTTSSSSTAVDEDEQRQQARKKIEDSLSHLETKEEIMDALVSMALKFLSLKKELEQEKTLREAFEKQLYQLTLKQQQQQQQQQYK